ncbi:adenosine deaminase-like protein [Artomyces pyxidatus]|uniref:Adenosine deaminase-like protein n=1 Tax=Artomyces pyxidatus TaxID=48021 RepID=A0ACB8T532_9AGAM|nr:adenosine deaminase-like protein [Artomyces pyxidatus]
MTVPKLPIAGAAAAALRALTPTQVAFLEALPKPELHAHLNGSIPLHLLQELALEYKTASSTVAPSIVEAGIEYLQAGVELERIDDFFGLFPAVYALTSNPKALRRATRAVLHQFLEGDGRAAYLELRSTPRATEHMSRRVYLESVLDEIETYAGDKAALIVSLDRRMQPDVAEEVVALAVQLRREGRRVVGVDLCGDPIAGDMALFAEYFKSARAGGLGVTLHIAETERNSADETLQLLACDPQRLGHATFLNEEAKQIVRERKICIEICLTSNLLCKTVETLGDHHIRHYLRHNHPIAICTDDVLPFRNSLMGEYALLMAPAPLGLGLSEVEIETVAKMGMDCRFRFAPEAT